MTGGGTDGLTLTVALETNGLDTVGGGGFLTMGFDPTNGCTFGGPCGKSSSSVVTSFAACGCLRTVGGRGFDPGFGAVGGTDAMIVLKKDRSKVNCIKHSV
eukprot:m.150692 g.150692  ORF g.150692 m.150692 type:complete len:101 (+) comp30738_c4_seq1:324-626(+)